MLDFALCPGDLVIATVRLRPDSIAKYPELEAFDGSRSTFLAAWTLHKDADPNVDEMAMIHPEWPVRWICSGDLTDIVQSDEDPFTG